MVRRRQQADRQQRQWRGATEISPGDAADRLDLRVGDHILSYSGARIESTQQLRALVDAPGGEARALTYSRGGETLTLDAPPGPLGIVTKNVRTAAAASGQ